MRKLIDRLKRLEAKIATKWPGIKTKLTLVIAGIAPLAGFIGYQVDPDAVIALIEDLGARLMALQAALIALAYWFRRLTKIYEEITGTGAGGGARPPGESG